ncbi:MAG: sodium-dependent transporter [Bacteroidota bacterium]|nr:sodium-dependent transporter [Bacteroidota bacterium]
MEKTKRENFGGRAAVIMALAGSAIGLGNIWRFPYMVGENGGAAFVLVYIFATLLISLPIFLAETVIGRRSGANCRGAMEKLAPCSFWKWFGYLSVITPMIIVSYYSVVGGWSLNYLWKACTLSFIRSTPEQIGGMFGDLVSSVWTPIVFHTIFLGLSVLVVAFGVKGGIERVSKFCLPVLFLLIVMISIYSLSLPGSKAGVEYLLKPDFTKLSPRSCAAAMGQSFYSLSLGMGIVITYSSYISRKENVLATGVGTAVSDLLFAILAGFAIMPAVFAAGIEPGAGAGLIFETLPFIFSKMGATMPVLCSIAAILFFVTILFAALTSCMSLVEVGVAYLIEEKHIRRGWACLWVFLAAWGVGVLSSLYGKFFDFLDMFSSNFLLTVGGLLCVLFVGWRMKKADVEDEFTNGGSLPLNKKTFKVVYFIVRYVAPIAVTIIFVTNFL